MFGMSAIAAVVTGAILVLIGVLLNLSEIDMVLVATVGLILLVGGAVSLVISRAS